jgi:CxxC-x17-CxxC domain-containing protein
MDFQDKTLTCKDCSNDFVWSAGEQKFYADKGLQNPPGRCQDCRKKVKRTDAQKFSIICKECGKQGEVPFQPRNPNDILCAECFAKKRDVEKAKQPSKVEPKAETEQEPVAKDSPTV